MCLPKKRQRRPFRGERALDTLAILFDGERVVYRPNTYAAPAEIPAFSTICCQSPTRAVVPSSDTATDQPNWSELALLSAVSLVCWLTPVLVPVAVEFPSSVDLGLSPSVGVGLPPSVGDGLPSPPGDWLPPSPELSVQPAIVPTAAMPQSRRNYRRWRATFRPGISTGKHFVGEILNIPGRPRGTTPSLRRARRRRGTGNPRGRPHERSRSGAESRA